MSTPTGQSYMHPCPGRACVALHTWHVSHMKGAAAACALHPGPLMCLAGGQGLRRQVQAHACARGSLQVWCVVLCPPAHVHALSELLDSTGMPMATARTHAPPPCDPRSLGGFIAAGVSLAGLLLDELHDCGLQWDCCPWWTAMQEVRACTLWRCPPGVLAPPRWCPLLAFSVQCRSNALVCVLRRVP